MNEIHSQNLRHIAEIVKFMELRLARRGSNHQLALHLTFDRSLVSATATIKIQEQIESLNT
jgi:hypothetical protein